MSSFARFHKHAYRWLGGYAREVWRQRRASRAQGPRHLLFALCDHYEPLWGNASNERGLQRVQRWLDCYPIMTSGLCDADGRPPRHTFFFPGEQYRAEYLTRLAELTRAGMGEVELHLHHDNDDYENLERSLVSYTRSFAEHGHLSRDPTGRLRYAFIHGNWCLANSRRDGRYCGVDAELELLFATGCYADFTFPSAPDETQYGIVNQIYWPTGDPSHAKAHERGVRARVGESMQDRILMVQGPLAIVRRPGKIGWRIDSAAITAGDPATRSRIETWIDQGIHVEHRPEWLFVKVHTHGAPETQADSLLGSPGRRLHKILTSQYNDQERFILHYVTAREMFNIALASMHGHAGNPNDYRDYLLPPPPAAA